MRIPNIFRSVAAVPPHRPRNTLLAISRTFSHFPRQEMDEFMDYIDKLKNYEKSGVPAGAGTDSGDGFDLGRMRRLLHRLGNPQSKFKAVHIAGTKGKGSTAAFLSSILRAQGYSVGCYTSPHIRSITERITLGVKGEPVTAKGLQSHFDKIKEELDIAVKLEKGHLSHFEVFTAIAFSIFGEEKVQFAVIEAGLGGARDATNVITSSDLATSIITNVGEEHLSALGGSLESIAEAKSGIIKDGRPVSCYVAHNPRVWLVLGGPFSAHIERILRDKARALHSPIVSASDPGNTSILKGFSKTCQIPHQLCDIRLQIKKDLNLFIELFDVQLRMLGAHQLQNAATATCAALCLRHKGWELSDACIRAGLESAILPGRSQFLTSEEADMLGLLGVSILLDGAHTKESGQALVDMIKMAFPRSRMVLVVSMANDKDHLGFAEVLLSVGSCLDAVIFTEIDIAGGRSRATSASLLKECWMKASQEKGVKFLDFKKSEHDLIPDHHFQSAGKMGCQPILFVEGSLTDSMRFAKEFLNAESDDQDRIIVFTGSLHIVSAVLDSLH